MLYGISNVAGWFIGRVIAYRRPMVLQHLQQALPQLSPIERKQLANRFYRNFSDNWIETIKLLSISRAALNQRITGNFEVFEALHGQGKSVQVNLGHFFNWEIMTLHTGINQPYTFLTVYLPQSSYIMNRLIIYIRSRWGNPQIPATDMARSIIPWRKKQFLLALGADQSPSNPAQAYWLYFLGKPAPFPKGPEKMARSMGLPVAMMTTTRPRRGHYHFEYFLLTDDPNSLPEGELMRRYVAQLEANIQQAPDLYLWSHNRWKRAWAPEYAPLWVDQAPPPSTL